MTDITPKQREALLHHMRYGKPKKAAVESARRGDLMLKEYLATGRVVFTLVDGKYEIKRRLA